MALIGSIALTLVVTTGCGDKATAPVGKFTAAQACDVATGSIGTFATAMLPWVYKTEPTTQTPTTKADYAAMYHGEFQQKLTTHPMT